MRNHHYALGAALLVALALPWTLAAAADLNARIDMQAVQLQPQEQNGVRYLQGGIGQTRPMPCARPRAMTSTSNSRPARKASSKAVPAWISRMPKVSPCSASRMPGRCCTCSCRRASTKSLAMLRAKRCNKWSPSTASRLRP